MTSATALGALQRLRVPVITTSDASSVLGVSVSAASHLLRRLASAGLVRPIRKGVWALGETVDPLTIVESVSAPYPSYVSLQTALHLHGMIEQIPESVYAVTLGRSARVKTAVGSFSLHHVAPGFFDGFDVLPSGMKLATPEKALVDAFYLSATRTRLFARLPEVELPRGFSWARAREWVGRIPSARLQQMASMRMESLRSSPRRQRSRQRGQ